MNIIDIGLNLTKFIDKKQIIDNASKANVNTLILTGSSEYISKLSADLCEQYPNMYFTAGIHPHKAKTYNNWHDQKLRVLAKHPKCVAIGETGLDYNRMLSYKGGQLSAFERQIQIALELGKPLFLHERDAHGDFIATLEGFPTLPKTVVHCFSGTESELNRYISMDLYIGITGYVCMKPRGDNLRKFVSKIRQNRLIIETDEPSNMPI